MKRWATICSAMCWIAAASPTDAKTIQDCASIQSDTDRIACYDRLAGQASKRPMSANGAACEAALVGRLISPSGYRLISIDEDHISEPVENYVDQQLYEIRDRNLSTPDNAVKERAKLREFEVKMKESGKSPTKVIVTIVYEAPNRMNAMIRDTEVCTTIEIPAL